MLIVDTFLWYWLKMMHQVIKNIEKHLSQIIELEDVTFQSLLDILCFNVAQCL